MPKVIVFDVDGTLIDSIPSIWSQYQLVSKKLGLPERSFQDFCRHLGKTWENVLLGMWPDLDVEEFSRHYDASKEIAPLLPGVTEVLEKLSPTYRLAILTSRGIKTLKQRLDAVDFDLGFFEEIFHHDNTSHHKPDPKVFQEVVEKLKVDTDEILYIGDALVDVECAQKAGVKFLGVLTGAATENDFEEAGAEYINSIAKLPDYLQNLN